MNTDTLYHQIRKFREQQKQPYYRILIAGYFNSEEIKEKDLNTEHYLKETIQAHLKYLTGYLYNKGLFYLHLVQSTDIKYINNYIASFLALNAEHPKLHNSIRIIHQSYQNSEQFFKNWDCDYVASQGPVLIDTDKTEQQIADRSFEIYQNLQDGAKKKKQNPSHKIANMFLLSNDDMSILICDQFMTLKEYSQFYLTTCMHSKECEKNYPLPSSIFSIMDFLEIEDYKQFGGK